MGSECMSYSDSENGVKKLRDIISEFKAVYYEYYWETSSVTSMNRILSWFCDAISSEIVSIHNLVVCE